MKEIRGWLRSRKHLVAYLIITAFMGLSLYQFQLQSEQREQDQANVSRQLCLQSAASRQIVSDVIDAFISQPAVPLPDDITPALKRYIEESRTGSMRAFKEAQQMTFPPPCVEQLGITPEELQLYLGYERRIGEAK